MKQIRLIVSDIDGTLIGREERLPAELPSVIERLEARGIMFTFATGRIKYMIDDFANAIHLTHPIISCNGAVIYQGRRNLVRKSFLANGIRPMLECADEMGMTVLYCADGVEYVFRETDWVRRKRGLYNRYNDVHLFSEDEWKTARVEKVNIVDDVRDGRVCKLYPLLDPVREMYSIADYGNVGLELVAGGVSKATGVMDLSKLTGIDTDSIMAFGDSDNDKEMLKAVGFGVAVAQATDSAKASADYICRSEGAAGVIETIEEFCLS